MAAKVSLIYCGVRVYLSALTPLLFGLPMALDQVL
jgi:hypothetical protein